MLSSKTIDQKFNDLRIILTNKDKDSIKMDAHGGNSILFIYPPREEELYLSRIKKDYPGAYFIDIAELFVKYIDIIGYDNFVEVYEEYKSEPEKLFKSESSSQDFYKIILEEIKEAIKINKIAIIIRTGVLFGTGIENISIMEESAIYQMSLPLIIMYPAVVLDDDKLKFLNCKLSSGYRAITL
ncbi:hypothetical protein CVT91_00355 [Candidatus Atribacteria bacterium HGW-Atribacteria-1]|nr:MAG: hypothetical protein CVT91_00355 [Candidatus Atribacteria bacterium HGW-Atribacteria-1]